ncbi:MAG: tetratricopeptide repeat protein [Hyphomicrobiaceae bacterium]|nr:MAG: tetratricopeptide repeat protein [Hyphomicrobiaceae bacterium]
MAQQEHDSLVREVDESLRQEKLEQLWKQHSSSIILGAIGIVLAVVAWQFYLGWRETRAGEMGNKFQAALEQLAANKNDEAETALKELAKGATGGYRTLSKLRLAVLEAQRGKKDEAVKLYDEIAADAQNGGLMRDFARIKSALLRVDSADFTEMENRLNELRQGQSSYRSMARELYGLSAWKHGKLADAEKEFQLLVADFNVPQATRTRAEVMLQLVTDAMPEKPAEKTETKPPVEPATKETAPPKSN